jgi:hypothetical protein
MVAVLRERAAVDAQQHRVALAGLEARRSNQPRIDLGAVRQNGRKALRLEQLRGKGRRHVGDTPVAGEELGECVGRRRDVHERAVAEIEPAHDLLTTDEELGLSQSGSRIAGYGAH